MDSLLERLMAVLQCDIIRISGRSACTCECRAPLLGNYCLPLVVLPMLFCNTLRSLATKKKKNGADSISNLVWIYSNRYRRGGSCIVESVGACAGL